MKGMSWLVSLSASIFCKSIVGVELRAMAAHRVGLGLANWSMREDKDSQTQQARRHLRCRGAGVGTAGWFNYNVFRKTLVMQGLSPDIQPTTLDKLFKFRPMKAGRSPLQLRRTRNDRSVARSQMKPCGAKMQPNTSAPYEKHAVEQDPTHRKGSHEGGER